MKKIINCVVNYLDPHRQSFVFFRWNMRSVCLVLLLSIVLTYAWKSGIVRLLLDNVFVYLPNYLTHEMLGHNFVGGIFYRIFYSSHRGLGTWLATLAGNGIETLIPFTLLFVALRLQGGRWIMPPLLYWLSTTFYGAGVYAQDARACSMSLTSSDMVTNYAPGEICGDWNHILDPIGLLNYDQWIAYTFLFIGSLLFMLAVYSVWYYWTHADQYAYTFPQTDPLHLDKEDGWQPPNIYTPQ